MPEIGLLRSVGRQSLGWRYPDCGKAIEALPDEVTETTWLGLQMRVACLLLYLMTLIQILKINVSVIFI
jgi:hypothetical protein